MIYKIKNIIKQYFKQLKETKKENLKNVWENYYIPKAISTVLKEQNYLTTPESVTDRAKTMLDADLAKGILDKFYRFKK